MRQIYYIAKDQIDNKVYKFNNLNQLLYWIHLHIADMPGTSLYGFSNYYKVLGFFKNIAHNKNDGNIVKDTVVEKYFDEIDRCVKRRLISIPPKLIQKRYIIYDSFNRIVNSAWLKSEFLKYIPNDNDHVVQYNFKCTNWIYLNKLRKQFKFRNGPVPCIHKYKKGHWHKINHSDHGFLGNECRATLGLISEQKDILEEFGFIIKYRNKRVSIVKNNYTGWNRERCYSKSTGWKRSKNKLKQWIK